MGCPLVSVVMPVYNGRRYLEAAVKSIQEQDYESLELVIVDDGSTDGSSVIADELAAADGRIRVVHQPNAGHAGAMNAGLAAARGEFAAVLDCDDEALPGRLERQVRALLDDPTLGAVGGAVSFMTAAGDVFHTERFPTEPEVVRAALTTSVHCPVLHSAMTMRRDVIVGLGGYRPALSLALDYDLWLRLDEQCRIANVTEAVVRYRIHSDQTTGTKAEAVAIENAAARASARARAAGAADPVPSARVPAAELRRLLELDDHEVAASIVDYATWYGKTSARAGEADAAEALFATAERAARDSGDPQLALAVRRARAAVAERSWTERVWADATRPLRRLAGRA